jgi:hypothetical protein
VGHVTNRRWGGNKMEGVSFHHFYFIYMAFMIDDKVTWTFNCHYNVKKMIVKSFDMNINNLTPPTYLCTYPPTHLLTYLLTYPPTHDPPTYLPTHPPTYSPTYLLTYLLLIYHPTTSYLHHNLIWNKYVK